MTLNPTITKEPDGSYLLRWTADPQAVAYDIISPDGSHVQAGKTATSAKLGSPPEPVNAQIASAKPGVYEQASYPATPPVPPPATLPKPPSPYTVPQGISVATSSALRSALAATTANTIIVEDGAYDHTTYAPVNAAHQVYARNLLKAQIRFGLQSSKPGARLQGLAIEVTDPAKCLNGLQVHLWGQASRWQILDTTWKGNDQIQAGIGIRSNAAYEGLVVQRVQARDFHSWGLLIDSNDRNYVPQAGPVLEDIYTENCVYKTNPQGSNGVSEAGLWVGAKCASVNRVHCTQVPGYATVGPRGQLKAWYGVWGGTALRQTNMQNIFVDGLIAFGVYYEHRVNADASASTISRLQTALPVNVGFHAEWTHPDDPGPTVQNVTIEDSLIESECVGVHYDAGTKHCTTKRTTFKSQAACAIDNYQGNGNLYDTVGNNYTGIKPGAVAVSTQHVYAFPCWNK